MQKEAKKLTEEKKTLRNSLSKERSKNVTFHLPIPGYSQNYLESSYPVMPRSGAPDSPVEFPDDVSLISRSNLEKMYLDLRERHQNSSSTAEKQKR